MSDLPGSLVGLLDADVDTSTWMAAVFGNRRFTVGILRRVRSSEKANCTPDGGTLVFEQHRLSEFHLSRFTQSFSISPDRCAPRELVVAPFSRNFYFRGVTPLQLVLQGSSPKNGFEGTPQLQSVLRIRYPLSSDGCHLVPPSPLSPERTLARIRGGIAASFSITFPRLKSPVILESASALFPDAGVNVCRHSRTFTVIRVMVRASPSFCKAWRCIMQYKLEAMRRNAKVRAHYRLFALVCAARAPRLR